MGIIRSKNFNAVAAIVAAKGTPEKGVTAVELFEELGEHISKATIHRVLREPGFRKSATPIWPQGFYMDMAEARFSMPPMNKDFGKDYIGNSYPHLPGKYTRDNPLGKYEHRGTVFTKSEPTTKKAVKLLAERKRLQPSLDIIGEGVSALNQLIAMVRDFKANGTKLNTEATKDLGRALRDMRAAGLFYLECSEIILSDPTLNTPEWWSIFDIDDTESGL